MADEDADENSSSSSSCRGSTFLNVVALGNVGAGKSAVLNNLIGHPVLPMGENGATRALIWFPKQQVDHLTNCQQISTSFYKCSSTFSLGQAE